MRRLFILGALALAQLLGVPMSARSDEGMWLVNDPPRQHLQSKYKFDLTDAWLERAMKASVRLNSGGSGGFVSADGLLVTNHHVAADSLQKLSTKARDLYQLGFYAKDRKDELKCPDLEINVLQSIADVTDRVNAAVKDAKDPAAARRAVLSEIEKESLTKTGLRSDVVTLYQGGVYHLYLYKKYTDVRLVFAPEHHIAGFGGDVDNFEYPRHGLDFAFFRAYENDKPIKCEHFFKWSETGPAENDLVFVTGHPGTTNRLETLAKLQHRRDVTLPYTLNRLRNMEAALTQYGDTGPEQRRQAGTALHSAANSRKAFGGQLQGLLDPKILEQKDKAEWALMEPTVKNVKPARADGWHEEKWPDTPWGVIFRVQKTYRTFEKEHALYETGHAFTSDLFAAARHCVRLADELPKKSPDRLREYRDSNLDSLKFALFSPAPVYKELERAKLQASLTFLAETLGGEHKLTLLALGGKNPAQRAAELVESGLYDPVTRKKLVDEPKLLADSKDPMIRLAKAIDPEARTLRKRYETEVEEPERQAYAELAKIRFAAFGQSVAPDATFTLRLAFGVVKGYTVDGDKLPFHTTFGSAFDRAAAMTNREPFELPERWVKGKDKLDPTTPFNFVSTADTIGGNSGSPVLNRAGELVGINFDRNRHGLVRNFVYTEVQARHIAVHSRAVLESLRKLYAADALASELTGK